MDSQQLIQLIVQQLQHYGHESVAKVVATELNVEFTYDPSPKLSNLLSQALNPQITQPPSFDAVSTSIVHSPSTEDIKVDDRIGQQSSPPTNQLVFPDISPLKDQPFDIPSITVSFNLPHPIHLCRFSGDAKFLAIASFDSSIRIYDTAILKSSKSPDQALLKLFNDQCGTIHDLAFHPSNMIIASASEDNQIRLYDLSKNAPQRKSFKYLSDSYPVWSAAFHPVGNLLLAGTAHSHLRMYDVQTLKCYTPTNKTLDGEDESSGGVSNGTTCVCISPNGKYIVTASLDGSVKIIEAESGSFIQQFKAAHNGHYVSSLEVSRSGAYLLSAGLDGTARLWHIKSGRTLKVYYGGSTEYIAVPGPLSSLLPGPKARFTNGEKHVLNINPSGRVSVWDSITANIVCEFGANTPTSALATNQVSPDIVCWDNRDVTIYS